MSLNEAEKQKFITQLQQFCVGLARYKQLVLAQKRVLVKIDNLSEEERKEFDSLNLELPRKYGSIKDVIEEYGGSAVILLQGGKTRWEAFSSTFNYTMFDPETFISVIDTAINTVNIAIGKLQSPALSESMATVATSVSPKAFIANGGETLALTGLREFLDALGLVPIIAQEQPSEDRSVDEQVEWCLDQCGCAIVLATKGDIDGRTGEFLPRGNILIEIGRCQERFPGRIVYLIESGTKFPTNISEKVRERFEPQHMDKAFIKVAKELTAFGMIKVVKPE